MTVRARFCDAALFTVRSAAVFTVDARARALRYNTARARQCPLSLSVLSTRVRPFPAPRHAAVAPTSSALLSLRPSPARALATRLHGGPRRAREVSPPMCQPTADSRIRAGIHPSHVGRTARRSRCRGSRRPYTAGRRVSFHGAPGENVRYAQRNARPSKRTGQEVRARAVTPRRLLSRLSLRLSRLASRRPVGVDFPTEFPPRSSALPRPRSATLGHLRPRSALRRRARPNEQ